MKISAFALASTIASCNAANDFSLRGFFGTESPVKTLEGQIVLQGVQEISAYTMQAIGDSIVSSYPSIESVEAQSTAVFSDGLKGGKCKNCPPDDESFGAERTATIINLKLALG